jgi:hypothetical protein
VLNPVVGPTASRIRIVQVSISPCRAELTTAVVAPTHESVEVAVGWPIKYKVWEMITLELEFWTTNVIVGFPNVKGAGAVIVNSAKPEFDAKSRGVVE